MVKPPRTARVVVFGDVIDDIVVRPLGPIRFDTDTESSISRRPGGSAANVAAWVGTLGVPVDMVGRVGEIDRDRHTAALRRLGVNARLTGDSELPTGTIVLLIDEQNRRTMLTERGANRRLIPADITDELLDGAAVVHFTGYTVVNGRWSEQASPRAFQDLIQRAKDRGVAVSVDPGSAGFLADFGPDIFLEAVAGANILFPSLDEGRVLTGLHLPLEIAAALSEQFPLVALTLGADGVALGIQGAAPVLLPVRARGQTDSTGAGDAFCAGFLTSWMIDGDAVAAAGHGCALAARAIAVVGGRPG